jgi:hypothetical protein
MPLTATFEQATQRRFEHHLPNGTVTWLSTYLGLNVAEQRATRQAGAPPPVAEGGLYPVAFHVEQAPNSTVPGHFHRADEFQVFLDGVGQFGNRAIGGMYVHYAGAYSAYAPIIAGSSGVRYVTLRNGWDPGARWMPQSRHELLPYLRRRRVAFVPLGQTLVYAGESVVGHERSDLISMTDDGMSAWCDRLGAGATGMGPDPSKGRGQYWFVVRGQCTIAGSRLDERGLAFVGPDEDAVQLVAGASGSTVVGMQFPQLSR